LKSWELNRRVEDLWEKMEPARSGVVRLDFESFSEAEQQLFNKVREIRERYGDSPPFDVMEANREFFSKSCEVISWRVTELFMFVMCMGFMGDEIEEWYFKLHFYNFFVDLNECLQRVRKWSEKDRQDFLKHNMMDGFFRIPRGFSVDDTSKRRKRAPKKVHDEGYRREAGIDGEKKYN
jgi:hypothetical protein